MTHVSKAQSYVDSLTEESEVNCQGACRHPYPIKQLYICKHGDCDMDRFICCKKCININHSHKSHGAYTGNWYIVCILDLLQPDKTKFDVKT